MATPFSNLYEAVRVVTGNDDPVVGVEVMPAARIDVLLRTAAQLLPYYAKDFPAVSYSVTDGSYSFYPSNTSTDSISQAVSLMLVCIAAHRYFIGIGNKQLADEIYADIASLILNTGDTALLADNEQTLSTSLIKFQGVTKLF